MNNIIFMPREFLSTLSLRRATNARPETRQPCAISIHALLAESDHVGQKRLRQKLAISIHALLAESDWLQLFLYYQDNQFLSTLSLRRATQAQSLKIPAHRISIHALLAESDPLQFKPPVQTHNFYPRSPCGERPCTMTTTICIASFLSTLSLRRATDVIAVMTDAQSISIHALLAESDLKEQEARCKLLISIHALLAESDGSKDAH